MHNFALKRKEKASANGRIRPKKKEKGACGRFSAVWQGDGLGFSGHRPGGNMAFC